MDRDVAVSNEAFELVVADFESQWISTSPPAIADFVDPDVSSNRDLLVELIRIDIEFKFANDLPVSVEDYLHMFETVPFTKDQVSLLAFEEYRLRFQHGESPDKQEYEKRFGISTDRWPAWKLSSAKSSDLSSRSRNKLSLPNVGDTVHGFELVGQLGQGAFGAVFLARETELSDRLVAIKLTEPSDIEPKRLARLQHTNIIPIYSLKKDEQLQSICMPFLGVATLRDLTGQASNDTSKMKSSGKALISTAVGKRASTIVESVVPNQSKTIGRKLEEGKSTLNNGSPIDGFSYRETVLWIYCQIADGLAYAHQRGVIHGDLKPGNVLIGDDGHPLILDFHLSRLEGGVSTESHVGGTLPYMSSNHLRSLNSSATVSRQCDIFSFGVMLYESLTGTLPYATEHPGENLIESLALTREHLPPPMRTHDQSIPRDLDTIVMNCLKRDGREYLSAEQLHEDLQSQLNNLPLRHAPNRSPKERLQKWVKRHPRLVSGTTIAAVATSILIGLSVFFFFQLSNLGKADLANQSRQFVQALVESQDELLDSHDDYQMRATNIGEIDGLVEARVGDDTRDYVLKLGKLPLELRNREKSELAYTSYLSAYQKLKASRNAEPEHQTAVLESALESLQLAEIAYESQPNWAIIRLKADVLESLGEQEKSEQLRKSLSAVPPLASNRDLMMRAVEQYRNDEFEASLETLQQLTRADAKWAPGWTLQGRNYERLGNLSKAELCYSTAISLNSDSAWGYIHRGMVRQKSRKYKLADEDFSNAIRIAPDLPVTFLNRALCRIELKNYQAALEDIDFAIKNDVPQTRAHYQRHRVHKLLNRGEEAADSLRTFMDLEPSDEKSWLSRGMAFIRAEQPEQALSDFESALKHNPISIDAWQNIATVQSAHLDGLQEAIDAMTRIVERRPEDLVARVTRGVLSARNRQFVAARQDAIHAVKRDNSADIYFRAAGVFALTSTDKASDANIAMGLLKKAAYKDGRRVLRHIKTDKDLDLLRERKDFIELIGTLESLSGKKK